MFLPRTSNRHVTRSLRERTQAWYERLTVPQRGILGGVSRDRLDLRCWIRHHGGSDRFSLAVRPLLHRDGLMPPHVPALSADARSLCVLIDKQQDRSVLPLLADALADAGDFREPGLRLALEQGTRPFWVPPRTGVCDGWYYLDTDPPSAAQVSEQILARLLAGTTSVGGWRSILPFQAWRRKQECFLPGYPLQSIAWLALAAALATPLVPHLSDAPSRPCAPGTRS